MNLLRRLGGARLVAAALAAATLPCLFLQHVETPPWSILFGSVAPGVAFFLIWAIPFDAMMARVFMIDAAGERRRRYRTIIVVDLLVWGTLAVSWGVFFWRLFSDR